MRAHQIGLLYKFMFLKTNIQSKTKLNYSQSMHRRSSHLSNETLAICKYFIAWPFKIYSRAKSLIRWIRKTLSFHSFEMDLVEEKKIHTFWNRNIRAHSHFGWFHRYACVPSNHWRKLISKLLYRSWCLLHEIQLWQSNYHAIWFHVERP